MEQRTIGDSRRPSESRLSSMTRKAVTFVAEQVLDVSEVGLCRQS